MPGGIKELLADVEVKTVDIQGSAVTTAKLGSSAVTTAKIARSVGKWHKETLPMLTAAATAYFSFLCTGAITILDVVVDIDTTGTGDLTCKDTSGNTVIATFATTTALTIKATAITTLAAGASLELACTASRTNSASGTIFILYIE